MRYNEFIERVTGQGLESKEEAVKAAEAALETLGERLHRTERDHLAAQLPAELKQHLLKRPDTVRFTLEEFYTRMSARSGVRYHHAVYQTKAVMAVLQEAVDEGELRHVLRGLPDDFKELFGGKPESPLSPSA